MHRDTSQAQFIFFFSDRILINSIIWFLSPWHIRCGSEEERTMGARSLCTMTRAAEILAASEEWEKPWGKGGLRSHLVGPCPSERLFRTHCYFIDSGNTPRSLPVWRDSWSSQVLSRLCNRLTREPDSWFFSAPSIVVENPGTDLDWGILVKTPVSCVSSRNITHSHNSAASWTDWPRNSSVTF